MKRDKIYFFQEFLITQINNLIFYPFAMTIVTLFADLEEPIRPSMLLWMVCGFLPLVLYLVRCKVSKFLPFSAAHIGLVASVFLFSKFAVFVPLESFQSFQCFTNQVLFVIMAIYSAAYSIHLKMKGNVEDNVFNMPVAVGIAAVSLFLQHYQDNKEWDNYYILSIIIVLALYFVYCYLKEYLNFLIVNASSTGVLPEKEIFSSGLLLAIVYTLIGALILLATSQLSWLKSVLLVFRNLLRTIIQAIAMLLPKRVSQDIPFTQTVLEEQGEMSPLPEGGEPALIWKVLEVVAVVAVLVLFVGLLIKAIIKLIAFVRKAMQRKVRTHDETLAQVQDVREKCTPIRKKNDKKQGLDFLHMLDSKERIRRIYKKKVNTYKPLSLEDTRKRQRRAYDPDKPELYTAREMQLEMGTQAFADIYEKARYSNDICSGQDVKRMKELCR